MSGQQIFYVRGGDGRFYEERPASGGGDPDYVPAEAGLSFQELNNGKFVAIRDLEEAQEQRKQSSHERYFQSLRESDDPRKQRQALKRLDKLQEQFERMAIDRASPVGVPNVEMVTDERFMSMMDEYQRAVQAGCAKESEFQPVTTYQAKLIRPDGRVLRQLYQGEVGIRGSTIVVLQEGYGKGMLVSVPGKVT